MRATKTAALALLVLLSLAFLLQGDLPTVPTGTWTSANSLAEGRSASAAALLQDGRILFTGGIGASGPLASAELFNTDGSFSAAAPMQNPRANHSAVILQDGRVLVAGGTTSGGGITSAAEIYDPASNTWTPVAGGMTVPRSNHTVSLLKDGTVLIAGGLSTSGALNSLEIFNPTTGAFAQVNSGTLSSARQDHAAAVLSDGRVLIAGGSDGSNSLNTADIYDPSSGIVSFGAKMSAARTKLSATTLIDGRVLAAGGSNGTADLATAEIYDPVAGTFSATGALAAARSGHLAFLLPNNNGVLIAGGSSAGAPLASAELFYSWSGAFNATGAMATARRAAAGSALKQNGVVLVAGGSDGTNPFGAAEAYGFATVKTDKADYAPGTTVVISGTGWQPGETVTLTMVESPLLDTHGPFTVVADSFGNFNNADFSPDQHDVNVLFYLTATGSVSQAQTTFTDANPASSGDGTMTVSPISVGAGSTGNTLKFTFTNSDNNKDYPSGSQVTLVVPSVTSGTNWTTPTTGNVAVANGTGTSCSPSLGTISSGPPWTIPVTMACIAGDSFTLTYSSVTAPTAAATYNFIASSKSGSGGTLTTLKSGSPTVAAIAATTTTVTSSVTPTVFGQSVTFTATVSPVAPATGTPTGTVQFKDGGSNLGLAVTLSGGVATLNTSALSVASHSITAVYSGSSDTPQTFTGSTSSAITQTVSQAATTTVVASSADPSVFGQSVTFTATITVTSPGAGTPTGTVQFKDNLVNLGAAARSAG